MNYDEIFENLLYVHKHTEDFTAVVLKNEETIILYTSLQDFTTLYNNWKFNKKIEDNL